MEALTVRLWSFALLRTSSASFWEQFSKSDTRIFVIYLTKFELSPGKS